MRPWTKLGRRSVTAIMIDGNEDEEEDQRCFQGTEVYKRCLFTIGLFVLRNHRLRFVVLMVVVGNQPQDSC